jgi:hypothetical protein
VVRLGEGATVARTGCSVVRHKEKYAVEAFVIRTEARQDCAIAMPHLR